MSGRLLFTVGFVLILAGFVAFFVGGLLLFLRVLRGKGRVKGGGLVMIGPFPIVFGTDKESVKALLLLSIVLVVLVLVFTMVSCYVLW